jgi:hypothetical protein
LTPEILRFAQDDSGFLWRAMHAAGRPPFVVLRAHTIPFSQLPKSPGNAPPFLAGDVRLLTFGTAVSVTGVV